MKKRFLIAGLLLVASAYAEDTKTKWDFSGSNVESVITVSDSTKDAKIYDGKDIDLVLKVTKQLDDKTTLSFKYDTDDSNPDYKIETLASRKFNEFVEAQIDMDLVTGDSTSNKGINMQEDYDSDKAFVKYTPNSNLAVKFNPFDIGLAMGDVFKTKNEQKTPGIQAEYKLSNNVIVYGGIGTGKYDTGSALANIQDKDNKEIVTYGYKAGATYKNDSTILKAAFSSNTQSDTDIKTNIASPLKMAANVIVEKTIGNLSIKGEAMATTVNKAANPTMFGTTISDSENGTALYAKAKLNLGENTPYAKILYASEYAYFDDKDYSATIASSSVAGHGGLTAIEVGNEFALKGGLKLIPYVEMKNTKNKVFKSNTKDQSIVGALKIKMTF